jgi:hypothetical protein
MGSGSSKMFLVTMRCTLDGQNGRPVGKKKKKKADSSLQLGPLAELPSSYNILFFFFWWRR